jgi:hypothetical protein
MSWTANWTPPASGASAASASKNSQTGAASGMRDLYMQDPLFQSEEFGTSSPAAATIIFICPYGTPIQKVGFAIRRLIGAGYHVVAYQTTTAVFMQADPMILPELISRVREDIRSLIKRLAAQSVTEFGFFGSSLGSFILYNCIGREIPELRWGVFNTGGNIARGVWNMPTLRQRHVAQGWSLPRLEQAWAKLQWPDFGPLDGCRFVFTSSRRDKVAPLSNISHYLGPMLRAGAEVSVYEVPAISHRTAVIVGLWKGPQLVQLVRGHQLAITAPGPAGFGALPGTAPHHGQPAQPDHHHLAPGREASISAARRQLGRLWSAGSLDKPARRHHNDERQKYKGNSPGTNEYRNESFHRATYQGYLHLPAESAPGRACTRDFGLFRRG